MREIWAQIAKKLKGLISSEFFAHENQRRIWQEQNNFGQRAQHFWLSQHRQTFSKSAVAHLIMILHKRDKSCWRQFTTSLATSLVLSKTRRFALICKPFREAAEQMLYRRMNVIQIISIRFICCENVKNMMNIVIPLRYIPARSTFSITFQVTSFILIIFEH